MARFEERNNDNKEEALDFGTEESGKVRMLGSWLGWKEDVDNRLKRAGQAWGKMKGRMVGSKMSKKMQVRVVETWVYLGMIELRTFLWSFISYYSIVTSVFHVD